MTKTSKKQIRILAVAPVSRGFGYAVLDGNGILADRGIRVIKGKGDKNKQGLAAFAEFIAHYQPGMLVIEDASAKNSRRSPRIRELTKQITELATTHGVKVKLYSREKLRRTYFVDGKGTKQELAEILAARFPNDVGLRVTPKRRAWDSDNYRMGIFAAVALALIPGLKGAKRSD